MMKALDREDEAPEIPLTSLIDVVFLLLVFFLVATNFVKREVDHQVKLPVTEGGAKVSAQRRNLVINVRADGTLVVDGSLVPEAELRGRIAEWRAENPDRRVTIRADARTDYASVARVFGLCRAERVTDVELPVMEPGQSAPDGTSDASPSGGVQFSEASRKNVIPAGG